MNRDMKDRCGFVISVKESTRSKEFCRNSIGCLICGYCDRHCLEHNQLLPTIAEAVRR